jgi:hypothetical protein
LFFVKIECVSWDLLLLVIVKGFRLSQCDDAKT